MQHTQFDCDYLVVGSGFGGSVSALRLAQKGWKVIVAEQGRRIGAEEIKAGKKRISRLIWAPLVGWKGFFQQRLFRHLAVVSGIGVGGGSIVWAGVMLRPKESFYRDPLVNEMQLDLKQQLSAHFDRAEAMLGVARNPRASLQDEALKKTAISMGGENSYSSVPNAIFFADDDQSAAVADPYFNGAGPERALSILCWLYDGLSAQCKECTLSELPPSG